MSAAVIDTVTATRVLDHGWMFVVRFDESEIDDTMFEWLVAEGINHHTYYHSDAVEVLYIIKDDVAAVQFRMRWGATCIHEPVWLFLAPFNSTSPIIAWLAEHEICYGLYYNVAVLCDSTEALFIEALFAIDKEDDAAQFELRWC